MGKTLDTSALVGIAKQVTVRSVGVPENISTILYNYDDSKTLTIDQQNTLLTFIHEGTAKWEKPKSMQGMLDEIAKKIGYDRNKANTGSYRRTYTSNVANRDDIAAIYAWVLNPNRK